MKLPLCLQASTDLEFKNLMAVVEDDLQLEITTDPVGDYFLFDGKGLSLMDAELGRLHLDFVDDTVSYARTAHRGKSELIAKAIGLSKGHDQVFDATLGLAQDAWFLVQLGAEVTGCERSPVVYLLLMDALRRSGESRLKIYYGNSLRWMKKLEGISTVYMDPMFPEKKKSALPRKEMRIFRKWVGEDDDATQLFAAALQSSAERLVVKRPVKAPPISGQPVHQFEGKTVRYDLYSPKLGRV